MKKKPKWSSEFWAQEIFWSMRNAKEEVKNRKHFWKCFSSKEVGSSIPLDCLLLIFFFVTWLYNWIGSTKKNSYTAYSKQNTANKQKKNHIVFTLNSYTTGNCLSLVLKIFFSPFIHLNGKRRRWKKSPDETNRLKLRSIVFDNFRQHSSLIIIEMMILF